MRLRHSTLAILLLGTALAACGRTGAPAPVELRGVGAGETTPGMARAATPSAPTQLTNDAGVYAPPPGYGTSHSVQSQNFGEPNDAYSQQVMSPPQPAAQQTQVLGQMNNSNSSVTTPPPAQTMAPAPATTPAATTATAPAAINQGSGEFGWPLRGRVLSGFGPKADGQVNDGINIAAAKGDAVYAAKAGTVTYAGNELKNFGNMVLVKHTGGMFTVYAHLDEILVAKDQKVDKGQQVGTVGTSGGVGEPQLHFEVRKGSNPQDPKGYLGQ